MNINDLVKELKTASDLYFNGDGESHLTDAEYDVLERDLRLLDPGNEFLIGTGSSIRGNGKVQLPIQMGGLDQVYEGDTVKWIKDNGLANEMIHISHKLDGTSILGTYTEDGRFNSSFSRGNGIEGADNSRHVRKLIQTQRVPGCVGKDYDESVIIRAETIVAEKTFEAEKERDFYVDRVYKNPRNFVAGQMNKEEAIHGFYKHADIVAYKVVHPVMDQSLQSEFLNEQGFSTAAYTLILGSEITDDVLSDMLTQAHIDSPWALDGLVLTINSVATQERLTSEKTRDSLTPAFAKKFKIGQAENLAITEIVAIHREVSKHGVLKPVIEVDPIDLMGVTISRATAFNEKFLKTNDVGVGTKVAITRSGDVIPFITKVVDPTGYEAADEEFGSYHWNANEVDIVLDDLSHPAVKLARLVAAFGTLEIAHAGEGNLRKLFNAGYETVNTALVLDLQIFIDLIGKNGNLIFDSIKQRLNNVTMETLGATSGAYGIGIGRRKLKKLVACKGRITDLTEMEISEAEGFAGKSAQKVLDGEVAFKQFLADIDGRYTIAAPEEKVVGGLLENEIIVFTGVRAKDLEANIKSNGGTVGSGINKSTTVLVCKDVNGSSSKLKKAKDLGIKIISLTEAQKIYS